jgi:hypothetical protein
LFPVCGAVCEACGAVLRWEVEPCVVRWWNEILRVMI